MQNKTPNIYLLKSFLPFTILGAILCFTNLRIIGFIILFVSFLIILMKKDFFLLSLNIYKIGTIKKDNSYYKYYAQILEEANLLNHTNNKTFNQDSDPQKEVCLITAIDLFNIKFLEADELYKKIPEMQLSKLGYVGVFERIFLEIMDKEPDLLSKYPSKDVKNTKTAQDILEILKMNIHNENFIYCVKNDLPEIQNIRKNLSDKTDIFNIIERKNLIEKSFQNITNKDDVPSVKPEKNEKQHITKDDVLEEEDNSWKI